METKKGKIFVTGDTHGLQDYHKLHIFAGEHPELTKDDYVIIAGDFGAVWDSRTLVADLKPFTELPFTVLFVDGNHENFDLINTCPVKEWHGGKVHQIRPNIFHLMRGQVFEIEGKTIFTFGGATSVDKFMRREGISWWPQELPTYEELDEGFANLKRYGNKVDFIITHSCGQRALMYPKLRIAAGIKTACPESHMLSNFEDIVEFKHWYFGHFHIDAQLSDKYTVLYQDVVEIK
ncbi:MAG: metallophosphoesterase [Clostridia bacterium]|nr:metallophosphoesterase [Clostridia bacterium]